MKQTLISRAKHLYFRHANSRYKKTKNRYSPWCISLSWRRGETRDAHGKVTRCWLDFWIFFRVKFWSSRTRFYREDDITRETSICKGYTTLDADREISEEGKNPLWVWYSHIFRKLSRCTETHSKRCKGVLLLSYATEISFRFSRNLCESFSRYSPFFCK